MKNIYKIVYVYDTEPDYYTLCIEKVNGQNYTEKCVFGYFKLNLINADEMELDPIGAANFIEEMKKKEMFFGEIRKDYFHAISTAIDIAPGTKSAEGMLIIEEDEE